MSVQRNASHLHLRFSYLFAVGLLLLGGTPNGCPATASERLDAETVFELDREDVLSIGPNAVVEICSRLLEKKEVLSRSQIEGAYRFRARANMHLQQFGAAKSDLLELLKLQPRDVELRCERAMMLSALGESEAALADIKEVIHQAPELAGGHIALAIELARARDPRGAMSSAATAVSLEPTNALAYSIRGALYYHRAVGARCVDDFTRALEVLPCSSHPDYDKLYVLRGGALLWLERPRDALPNFLLARRLNPKSFLATLGLCQAYAETKRWHIAYKLAREAIDLNYNWAQSHCVCALACVNTGRETEALEQLAVAEKLAGGDEQILWITGDVLCTMGRYREAIAKYDDVLKTEKPTFNGLAHCGEATILAACSDPKLRDGRKALQLAQLAHRECAASLCWRTTMAIAMGYAESGDFGAAVAWARKSLDSLSRQSAHRREYEGYLRLFEARKPARLETVHGSRISAPDRLRVQEVFELDRADGLSISPNTVVEVCSRLLKKKDVVSRVQVEKAYEQRASAYVFLGQWDAAMADLAELLKLRPDDVQVICQHASGLGVLGKLDEALAEIRDVMQRAPESADANVARAEELGKQGYMDAAFESATRALELEPTNASAYGVRGLLSYYTQDFAGCVDDLTRSLDMCPVGFRNEDWFYCLRGRALLVLERPREALVNFLMARKLDEKSLDARSGLCQAYAHLKRWRIAYRLAHESLELDRKDARIHCLCALTCARTGREKEAVDELTEAQKLCPENPEILCSSGNVLLAMGHYRQAIAKYEHVIELDKKHGLSLLGKATVLATCPDATLRDGRKALDLALLAHRESDLSKDKYWRSTMIIAMAYAENGDFKAAVSFAKKSLKFLHQESGRREEYEGYLRLFEAGKPARLVAPEPSASRK